MIRIGPAINVPRIRNKMGLTCLLYFFVSRVRPTTTGKKVNNKKKSYLSKGPKVASPMKNFDGSI